MGRNCVREALVHASSRVKSIWIQQQTHENSRELDVLRDLSARGSVTVRSVDKDFLCNLVNSTSHQGVVAEVEKNEISHAAELLTKLQNRPSSLVVGLDGIEDPQNLGSILRCAECFKVDAVFWSRNRGCGLTPAAAKVSSGASEVLLLAEVANLADAVRKFKESDYWIVGVERRKGSAALGSFTFPEKCVLLFGSEGDGLHSIIRKLVDYSIEIPQWGSLDSLNVGQAAAVFLYEWRRARGIPPLSTPVDRVG